METKSYTRKQLLNFVVCSDPAITKMIKKMRKDRQKIIDSSSNLKLEEKARALSDFDNGIVNFPLN